SSCWRVIKPTIVMSAISARNDEHAAAKKADGPIERPVLLQGSGKADEDDKVAKQSSASMYDNVKRGRFSIKQDMSEDDATEKGEQKQEKRERRKTKRAEEATAPRRRSIDETPLRGRPRSIKRAAAGGGTSRKSGHHVFYTPVEGSKKEWVAEIREGGSDDTDQSGKKWDAMTWTIPKAMRFVVIYYDESSEYAVELTEKIRDLCWLPRKHMYIGAFVQLLFDGRKWRAEICAYFPTEEEGGAYIDVQPVKEKKVKNKNEKESGQEKKSNGLATSSRRVRLVQKAKEKEEKREERAMMKRRSSKKKWTEMEGVEEKEEGKKKKAKKEEEVVVKRRQMVVDEDEEYVERDTDLAAADLPAGNSCEDYSGDVPDSDEEMEEDSDDDEMREEEKRKKEE
ncbi:hypothetical protein PFISCL1PPCAC_13454, partial [Pristionchus fissidentatus]